MDSESENSDDGVFNVKFVSRQTKKNELNPQAQKEASSLASRAQRKVQINPNIDHHNKATKLSLMINYKNNYFSHFMMKNDSKSIKKQVLEKVRQRLQQKIKPDQKINNIADKQSRQIMVVRFIYKQNDQGLFTIEDQSSRSKISVTKGIVWVGLICAIEAVWTDNMYKLQRIIDLGEQLNFPNKMIVNPPSAYRILMMKGPFRRNNQKEDIGYGMLIHQLEKLREKDRISVDCIIIMGPLLSNCSLDKTFEEELNSIMLKISTKIKQISSLTQVFFQTGIDDVTNYYPIPQPQYQATFSMQNTRFLSNPSTLQLSSAHQSVSVNVINYDILNYIDKNKGGNPLKEVILQNFQTYLKQTFLISNATDAPFDEVNLPLLYKQRFGDIIIMSSQYSPPYAKNIDGRLIVNIGSLGMDYHYAEKHFMSLLSIYDGDGPLGQRCKVQSIIM